VNFARSSFNGASSRGGEFGRSRTVALVGLGGGGLEIFQPIGAGVDQRDVGGVFRGQRREAIDRRGIFARCRAQREQPLLDALELRRIEVGCDQRGVEVLVGLLQRVDGGIDRLHGGLDQRRRIGRTPFEPADRRRQCRHRRVISAHGVQCLAQIGGNLLALHHARAALCQHGFLAVLGRKLLQLVGGMPEVIRLARGTLHASAMFVEHGVGGAPCVPELLERGDVFLKAGKRVEQPAVG
jgi:hypothetical protein